MSISGWGWWEKENKCRQRAEEEMRGYASLGLGGGYSLLSANVTLSEERNAGGLRIWRGCRCQRWVCDALYSMLVVLVVVAVVVDVLRWRDSFSGRRLPWLFYYIINK